MRSSRSVSVPIGLVLALCCAFGAGALAAGAPTTLYLPAIAAGPAPTAAPPPTVTPDPNALVEQRVAELINAARADHGLPPFEVANELTQAARRHSADMAANSFFDHIGSDESTPGRRIEEAGYAWYACGENIAAGHATPEDVVNAWLGSEGHRAAIFCTVYHDMGVGYAYDAASRYGRYYTVDFARRTP